MDDKINRRNRISNEIAMVINDVTVVLCLCIRKKKTAQIFSCIKLIFIYILYTILVGKCNLNKKTMELL